MSDKSDFITKSTETPSLPEESISNAIKVLKTGKLFRYGENNTEANFVSKLESKFAEIIGCKYAVAVNSGGSAIYIALKAAGIMPNEVVALNVFTLAPVPGALENSGAEITLLDVDENLTLNASELEEKLQFCGAKALVLSHMRGHVSNLQEIVRICDKLGVILIEDCAHTMGAKYNKKMVGSFGKVGCFSFQTYKQVNSGEGGILVTDDPDIAAKAILYSGSYMLYHQHDSRPGDEFFLKYRSKIPNYSLRMNELCASVLSPQLDQLDDRNSRWREIYSIINSGLEKIEGVTTIKTDMAVLMAPTSIQFHIDEVKRIPKIINKASDLGLKIKWFGSTEPIGFTSNSNHWEYISPQVSISSHLVGLCDIRLPVTLDNSECQEIVEIISRAIRE